MLKRFRLAKTLPTTLDTAKELAVDSDRKSPDLDASWIVVVILISVPLFFSAISLFPEFQYCTPTGNDQVFHYLFIERADQAISAGDNPFDHWLPELELGFPQFLYYQNLPHLTVVALYRLLLRQIALMRVFNLIRYLLLVIFPLTVYWSMRQMQFPPIASAVAAAFSPMLSSRFDFGFDFRSYIWSGFGMFPQLCAMHIMFIACACVHQVLTRGRGLARAILVSSAMILVDLLYGYMLGILVAVLWMLTALKLTAGKSVHAAASAVGGSVARLTVVFVSVAAITSYQVIPFFVQIGYLNQILPRHLTNLDAPFAGTDRLSQVAQLASLNLPLPFNQRQLALFFGGHFFDNGRLPMITLLVLLGIAWSLIVRRDDMLLALTMLGVWMFLLVPNQLRDRMLPIMPFSGLVPFFRFVSGVDFGAILIVGIGGEFMWRWCRSLPPPTRSFLPIILALVFYSPAIVERWQFYQRNTTAMEVTKRAIEQDKDLAKVILWLEKAPPGRVYAGTRGNWGNWLKIGAIHLYDLLPIERFETVMPWQTLSLNAPLLWRLNIPSESICRVFNIRYVIAPPSVEFPDFYHSVLSTSNYSLYEVESGGYLQFGYLKELKQMKSSEELLKLNSEWITGTDPAYGKFTAFLAPNENETTMKALHQLSLGLVAPSQPGSITDEIITPDSIRAQVTAPAVTLLVIKMTYHPNWHVFVDGRENPTFMVSPSYIGTIIRPGHHLIQAGYRSSNLKNALLGLSFLTCVVVIATWVRACSYS